MVWAPEFQEHLTQQFMLSVLTLVKIVEDIQFGNLEAFHKGTTSKRNHLSWKMV